MSTTINHTQSTPNSQDKFQQLLSHFRIKSNRDNHYQVYCPAHDDKNASLSITIDSDKALIFCHAGCTIDEILKVTGLEYGDLFLSPPKPTGIYQYRNADGTLHKEKVKFPTPDGKRFVQRRIDNDKIVQNLDNQTPIPYNYPDVIKAIKQGAPILYVEGEKDANTARLLGYTSTTMGGASDWKPEYAKYFAKADLIQIPDSDDAGLKLAHKVTESLKGTCKSLKMAILPKGKDLTEWVETGNGAKDLNALISESPELLNQTGFTEAIVTKTITGYDFHWINLNLLIKIERLTNDVEGMIKIIDNGSTIHVSKINLLATRSLTELSNRLSIHKKIDWNALLSSIANKCANALSDGGITEDISCEPTSMNVRYLIDPIIPLNEPVTIFTAGGKGKSIFADYLCVLLQYGELSKGGLPFVSHGRTNVLYLDWEADKETHRRYITAIKRGLGITENIPIAYRFLEYPLAQVIDSIRQEIERLHIEFVVIDSQMAATSSGNRGMTEAQVAGEYYNLLRSFKCSTLTIDHITKQGMTTDSGAEAPYGSVVKYNRSRSQFELRLPEEDEDDDHKEYALVHRKFNLGRKQRPIGIMVDFTNVGDTLEKIVFQSCELKDSPKLAASVLTLKQQLCNAIKGLGGKASAKEMAEYLGITDNTKIDSINSTLNKNKNTFINLERGIYGLLQQQ